MKIMARFGIIIIYAICIPVFVIELFMLSWALYPIVWILSGRNMWQPSHMGNTPIMGAVAALIDFINKLEDYID